LHFAPLYSKYTSTVSNVRAKCFTLPGNFTFYTYYNIPSHRLPWRITEHPSRYPWIQRRRHICLLHNGSDCGWHIHFHQTGKLLIEMSQLLACKCNDNKHNSYSNNKHIQFCPLVIFHIIDHQPLNFTEALAYLG